MTLPALFFYINDLKMKAAIIFILLFHGNLFGQDYPGIGNSTDSLRPGLKELIRSAVNSNLGLAPIDYESKILSARINQVSKQPSPMLQFMVDYLPVNFENAGEYSLIYSQPLKLFGKLGADEKLAQQKTNSSLIERKRLETDLIKSVKENYFMLSLNQRLLGYNDEYQQILGSITRAVEINYSVGKGEQYQIIKSNSELDKLQLEEIELKNNRLVYLENLRTLSNLNLPDDYDPAGIGTFINIEIPDLNSSLSDTMSENNPDIKMLEQLQTENDLERSVTAREKSPDITLESGYRYMTPTKESMLLFSLSFDLPFMPWNDKRIESAIDEKVLAGKKINSELLALKQNLKSELKNNLTKINSSREKLKYLTSVLIPRAELSFKSILLSYEKASAEYIDLLDSYRSLRENKRALIEEEANYLVLVSNIEKIIGKQILIIN